MIGACAEATTAARREEYNRERPHSNLGCRPPTDFAALASGAGQLWS
ncbi:MAG: transposase [Acidobacteria bacterium]|nr:transposase [Acidobacteriota bacterium]